MSEPKRSTFRSRLRALLQLGDSPDRTALAFAVGVFLGFSPFVGLHTILGLAVAFAARLNRPAVMIGVWSNTPWTLAPAASLGTAMGFVALGIDSELKIDWSEVLSKDFWTHMLSDIKYLLLPFFVGNLLLSVLVAGAGFWGMRWFLRRHQVRKDVSSSA